MNAAAVGDAAIGDIVSGGSGAAPSGPTSAARREGGAGSAGDAAIGDTVAAVRDPEIRVLTIAELGILRDVTVGPDGRVTVTITPTYTGCPALDVIRREIRAALRAVGCSQVEVCTVLSPAWTTDWITDAGRAKLSAAGIAPPGPVGGPVPLSLGVRCPHCGDADTEQLSRFGSTACKALWRCRACREPFDAIKSF